MDYWNIYKDVWNFHKKYTAVREDDAYWQDVIRESDSIAKKYNNCKFVVALLLAVVDELDRTYKEARK